MTAATGLPQKMLAQLRDQATLYFKFDLTYIAAGFTLVTALRLSNSEALYRVGSQYLILIFVTFLVIYDSGIRALFLEDWIESAVTGIGRMPTKLLKYIAWSQPVIHSIFICIVIGFLAGYSNAYYTDIKTLQAEADIQTEINSFYKAHNRLPTSIAELSKDDVVAKMALTEINNEPIRYTVNGKNQYVLIFAGPDGKFGTTDDIIGTSAFSIQNIVNELKKSN